MRWEAGKQGIRAFADDTPAQRRPGRRETCVPRPRPVHPKLDPIPVTPCPPLGHRDGQSGAPGEQQRNKIVGFRENLANQHGARRRFNPPPPARARLGRCCGDLAPPGELEDGASALAQAPRGTGGCGGPCEGQGGEYRVENQARCTGDGSVGRRMRWAVPSFLARQAVSWVRAGWCCSPELGVS